MNQDSLFGTFLACCLIGGCKAIVGGDYAEPGELPYLIRLQRGGLHVPSCSGALLDVNNKQFVVTLASCCIEYTNPETGVLNPVWAVANEYNMTDGSSTKQTILLNRAINHPDASYYNQHLCILGSEDRFSYTENIKPAQLPKQGQNTTGDVRLYGWGYYGYQNWSMDYVVRKLELPLISEDECVVKAFAETEFSTERFMKCAFDASNQGAGSCVGDQGGPAVSLEGNYLMGIIRMQPLSCEGREHQLPDVYLEVSQFIDWIEKTTNDL